METERKVNPLFSLIGYVVHVFKFISESIEYLMFKMMYCYDLYVYTPLQIHLSPLIARIPRFISFGNQTVTIFNANIVTYSRTLLIIPISWLLKYNYATSACLVVVLHDFLDHVDGIVAKVHKRVYGENIDDSFYGGFIDAFCDKIVNVFSLWTILQATNFQETSFLLSLTFISLCYTIIALETAIGIVRIEDYFSVKFQKTKNASNSSTTASMEGKLKEKLESMGLAFLCLSTGSIQPFHHWSGISGIICFTLTIRLAYASLMNKLETRKKATKIDVDPSPIKKATN